MAFYGLTGPKMIYYLYDSLFPQYDNIPVSDVWETCFTGLKQLSRKQSNNKRACKLAEETLNW